MSVSEELIHRLSSEIGQRLTKRARTGRERAIASISQFCVTVTVDGQRTWDEVFDGPPTLGQLVDRVGSGAFIVSTALRRRSLRKRLVLAFAAE